MRKTLLLFLALVLWACDSKKPAKQQNDHLTCLHPQACALFQELVADNLATHPEYADLKWDMPIHIKGDPHHFDPSTGDIKKIFSSSRILLPPRPLTPWATKLKAKIPTENYVEMHITAEMLAPYGKAQSNRHPFGHFWVYPHLRCELKKQLAQQLGKWNLKFPQVSCPFLKDSLKLKALSKKLMGYTVILSHDALLPLLKTYDFQVMTLKGSHAHEEVSPKKLKTLAQLMEQKGKVIWVLEKDIRIPKKIQSLYIQKEHPQIHLDLGGHEGDHGEHENF